MTSSSSHQQAYDVYVSFRSEDIRKTFMDHFFSDLKRKGIHVYGDNNQLNKGDDASYELYKTIEQSRVIIVIFSTNYASSTLCLKELVKIIECKENENDKYEVWPIFYNVTPSMVRNQTGSYKEAIMNHEILNKNEVFKWKKALNFIGNLSGWDLQNTTNGNESKFIDIISKEIFYKLIDGSFHIGNNLVGLDTRVDHMDLQRFVGSNRVHIIGICGIGGIGKTTVAKAIYNLIYKHFEACSFCENVKSIVNQNGLVYLQKKLLDDTVKNEVKIKSVGKGMKGKKVFIVLDDVDHQNQFEALARNPDWFSEGSLIVVTGRDRQLLISNHVEEIYEIALLNDDEAFELFSNYAFRDKKPDDEFMKFSKIILQYVDGLPLALKTYGGFLFNKTLKEWKIEIDQLQISPTFEIQKVLQVLRVSYDELDFDQKHIFLDIACFFEGEKKDYAMKILGDGELFLATNITVLVDKSLITIREDRIQMHNLVKEMGRQIVREEYEEIGKRSRLWSPIDVIDVLENNKGTEFVKGVSLDISYSEVNICGQSLKKLKNLRLLNIYIGDLNKFRDINAIKYKVKTAYGKLEFLSNELQLLCWHGYPFQHLPPSFYPENLFVLDLSYSCIQQIWSGSKYKQGFKNLTSLNLSHCHNLRKTPDFKQTPNLKDLILKNCANLVEIHPSIKTLKSLITLNLENCKNLKFFPNITELESLKHLNLSNCSKMAIPSSLFSLSSFLRIYHGPVPLVLPSLSSLSFLRVLKVGNLNLSGAGLSNLESLCSLEELDMSGNDFITIDANFSRFVRLSCLRVIGCKKLRFLPELPCSIVELYAQNCVSLVELPKLSTVYDCGVAVFDFMMCWKVVEKLNIERLLMMLLPQGLNIFKEVHIFLPGSKIPRWITNQSIGNCITVDLPPHWCHKKSKGLTICAVITPITPNTTTTYSDISCRVKTLHGDVIADVSYSPTTDPDIESDQIWLGYRRSDPKWKKVDNQIIVSFKCVGVHCEVKQCGVRIVCEEDEQMATIDSNMILIEDEPKQKKIRVL